MSVSMRVPRVIAPEIVAMAQQLADPSKLNFIDYVPRSDGELNDCFMVVEKHVTEHGGTSQIGWKLFEWPSLFLEAIFHAVWRSPSGVLIDVTPERNPAPKML